MVKAIVTGAAGFIGSHLSKRLEADGYSLLLLDDFSRGKKRYLDYLDVKTKCMKYDLTNLNNNSDSIFKDVDVVFHIASKIGGNQYLHGSPENELSALQTNLLIDRNVFNACFKHKVPRIVYTSSVSVYNTRQQMENNDAKFTEDSIKSTKIDPEGGYGWAKYIGEKQLELLSKVGTNTGIIRIFKSYGPCDDYSDKSGQVVCSLMRKAINYPKERYVVWGDGTVTRCLVYIDDLIDGIIKVANYTEEESITVNMGGQFPIPIIQLSKYIIKIAGKNIIQEHDMGAPVGVKSRIPVLERAKEILNWQPTTTLEAGLKETYKWMKHDITNH